MSNIRFVINNQHDTATLTATSEATPIDYTKDQKRGRVWRSTDATAQLITGTLPSPTHANSLVIGRHNFSSDATLRLILKNGAIPIYDSGSQSVEELIPCGVWRAGIDPWGATFNDQIKPQIGTLWFDIQSFDNYELTITDTANPNGFYEVSRIFLGLSFEPTVNFSMNNQLEWFEDVEHERSAGGSLHSNSSSGVYRRLTIPLDWLNEADRTALLSNFYGAGKGSDLYVSCYPEAGGMKEIEYSFIAKRENNYSVKHNIRNNWQSQLVLVEA